MQIRARWARWIAASLVAYLVASLLGGPVAAAAELTLARLKNPDPVPVSGPSKHRISRPDHAAGRAWSASSKASWPRPGVTTVNLAADAPETKAGTLPLRMTGRAAARAALPRRAQVQVLDQKTARALGMTGVILAVRTLEGGRGTADIALDYSGFQNAYGGDWASRLTLRQLPSCVLTTPDARGCQQSRSLASDNDVKSKTLSASVALPAASASARTENEPVTESPAGRRSATGRAAADGTVLLAVTAAASGASGDFKATPLSSSASWSAGGSSGAFTWTYDIATPEVPGGAQPDLGLSYSSQAVDGRTAATNNQANWIGDGWSMEPGYIERRYVSCADDASGGNGTDKSGDQCWKKDNAVLNLGGQSNVLVRDGSSGEWHLEDDDGTKVEKVTDTSRGNDDDNGEYWQVTTPDGTRYYFGYNRLPGWSEGKAQTNSTWTTPVFGNHDKEPCHADAYKDSWCQQAWRWNLDYVVDPHSDAMAYYWTSDTNYYGRNVNPDTGASTATAYDRGGYLDHIEYGLRSDAVYSQKAAGRVDFTVAERCLSDCGTFDKDHAKNWPDVPFDQYCKFGDECKDRFSPSFWTRKRLTKIDTLVLTGGAYKNVDTWQLAHGFPPTGDGTDPALWLSSITRTGHTGTGDVTMPAVTFKAQKLANRVEGATTGGDADPVPPLVRYRVYGIDTETGGTIGVTYSPADCKPGNVPTPSSNTRRCYPVMWSPPDAPAADYEPYLDWFHTYVVDQVLEADNTGGAPVKETDYDYLEGMAWGKEEDEFTKAKYLTYGDRQGYGRVQVRTGAPASDRQTLKEYRYFRGIAGAQVKDHEGIAVTDHPAFAGMPREEATFNGVGGTLETTTSYEPWHGAATATQTRTGLSALEAYATGTRSEKTRTAVGTGWRSAQTVRTFNEYGQVTSESDLGDTAKTGDEECTTTTYARNASKNILDLTREVKHVAVACDQTPQPADLISVARTYYDNATSPDTAPAKGDITRIDEQDAAGTGYLTTAKHTYDIHGRELTDTDADGTTTVTEYSPKTIEAPESKTETNVLEQAVKTEYDPTRGATTATVDANGKRTDATLDGLGRVLKVWLPGWPKADHAAQPSTEYTYTISKTDANAVATKTLQYDGSYAASYQLYDGLLRERETQTRAIGTPDRLVTETLYDSRGFAYKSYAAYYAEGAPSVSLAKAPDNKVPSMTENLYDGAGRVTDAITRTFGDEKWRTKTLYGGDRTTVIPPKGGTATTNVTDIRGRTAERIEYTNAARTTSQKTLYKYGKWDEPTQVIDPSGNTWTYTFDARGQQVRADDPDKGTTKTTYDNLGREKTITDARDITLTTEYDALGRKAALKKGATLLAKWTYDTVAKGHAASSTRYVDGKAYTFTTDAYDDRYQPTSTTVTIPAETGALAGTYTWTFGYNAYTGQQEWIKHPAVGSLPSERQTTVYGEGNLPQKTTAGSVTLVNSTAHDVFSRPARTEYGTLGKKVYRTQVYDEVTGRMTRQTTDRDLAPQRIDDMTYTFDDAGNIASITTASGQDAARTVDTQCFTNDALQRLTEAWTAKTDCTTPPSATTVGGPDAYWQSFDYDAIGNRTKLTDHGTGALSGTDATTTYAVKNPGTGLPHAVQEATVKGGSRDGQKSTFTYDSAGNTKKRTIGASTQDLTWDDEGHLATLTESGQTTSYLYDADGDRMITHDADGSQTLTLPGDNELKVTKDGVKQGVRYYTHGGETVAVRTSSGFSFLLPDHQGTAMTAVAMTTLAITRRKQLPFGGLRSETSNALPGSRGFVGGTNDPSGLIHLGAREYDPTLGRFISVDPLINIDDPQQMNAYAYANNRPITAADPDGQMIYDDFTGQGYGNANVMKNYYKANGYIDSKGRTTKKYRKRLTAYNKSWSNYYASSYYKTQLKEAAQANARIAARLKAQAEARRKAQEAERRKKGILASVKSGIGNIGSNIWDRVSPDTKISLYLIKEGAEYMWDHGYVSGSACLMVCFNLGFQRGVVTAGITGGLTFGGTKGILSGNMGNYAGISAGINTAKPNEQAFQVAGVTSANGFKGGTFAWGKRTTGGNYYQYGWAGGKGTALQGPMLMGAAFTPGKGITWYPYSN
ncbi:RHS repeat domain-containing protein [Streptomyces canus]|uniref:RHS repeat domain-containing protein n=1 Tax=Streptomyces canus TaxID=58343 RepID=UPI0038678948